MVFQPISIRLEGQLPNKWGIYQLCTVGLIPLPVLHIHCDVLVHKWPVLPYCLSTVFLSRANLLFSQQFSLCASVTLKQAKSRHLLPPWSKNSIYGHTEVLARWLFKCENWIKVSRGKVLHKILLWPFWSFILQGCGCPHWVSTGAAVGPPPLHSQWHSYACSRPAGLCIWIQLWGELCWQASVKAMSKLRGGPLCPSIELEPFLFLLYKCSSPKPLRLLPLHLANVIISMFVLIYLLVLLAKLSSLHPSRGITFPSLSSFSNRF